MTSASLRQRLKRAAEAEACTGSGGMHIVCAPYDLSTIDVECRLMCELEVSALNSTIRVMGAVVRVELLSWSCA